MTGEVVNLRRARKAKSRAAAEDVAAARRLEFGTAKSVRRDGEARQALEDRRFEAHRLDTPARPDDMDDR